MFTCFFIQAKALNLGPQCHLLAISRLCKEFLHNADIAAHSFFRQLHGCHSRGNFYFSCNLFSQKCEDCNTLATKLWIVKNLSHLKVSHKCYIINLLCLDHVQERKKAHYPLNLILTVLISISKRNLLVHNNSLYGSNHFNKQHCFGLRPERLKQM